jgi:hypothetical protein
MMTLQATLRSLGKKAYGPDISTEDKIRLLLLFNELPEYHEQAVWLFDHLSSGEWTWLSSDDIYLVCLRLLALYRHNAESIDGEHLALLAKRLIEAEKTVGGPYKHKAHSALQTNAVIAQLMRALGSSLPNVEQFVQQEAEEHRLVVATPENGWLLAWPERIVTVAVTRQLQTVDTDSLHQIVAKLCLRLRPSLSKKQGAVLDYMDDASSVSDQVVQESLTYPEHLRSGFDEIVQKIITADHSGEIRLVSSFFVESLSKEMRAFWHDEDIQALNKANFHTWIAYTIYDDFIDDEGSPSLLPVANTSHRKALAQYHAQAYGNGDARMLVDETFDRMDAANAWELQYCRFPVDARTITIGTLPDYKDNTVLAERAGAHILGPLLVALRDTTISRQQYSHLRRGLEQYLIARQLNDDIHDWVKDLRAGQCSPVVRFLLQEANIEAGSYASDELIESLQNTFWQSGLEKFSLEILEHTKAAEGYLRKSNVIKDDSIFIHKTLLPIEQSARKAMTKHRKEKSFLASYVSEA